MHESALARQILEYALAQAEQLGRPRIRSVRGWIAETERLAPEALRFHFRAHARGTAAEAAELELELTHVHARCDGCGTEYAPDHHLTLCPACGDTRATLQGNLGLGIESISVEEP
jgi:hydrogenase nickel incorporation protein HypA/HybF